MVPPLLSCGCLERAAVTGLGVRRSVASQGEEASARVGVKPWQSHIQVTVLRRVGGRQSGHFVRPGGSPCSGACGANLKEITRRDPLIAESAPSSALGDRGTCGERRTRGGVTNVATHRCPDCSGSSRRWAPTKAQKWCGSRLGGIRLVWLRVLSTAKPKVGYRQFDPGCGQLTGQFSFCPHGVDGRPCRSLSTTSRWQRSQIHVVHTCCPHLCTACRSRRPQVVHRAALSADRAGPTVGASVPTGVIGRRPRHCQRSMVKWLAGEFDPG